MEKHDKEQISQPEEIKTDKPEIPPGQEKQDRNLGLSVLLIFSFVYNGILLLVLAAGLFYPDLVHDILQQYYKQVYLSGTVTFVINLIAVIVLGISFYGLLLLWRFRKKGFYLFAAAQTVVILTMLLVLKSFDWINIGVVVVILVIFGISSRSMK